MTDEETLQRVTDRLNGFDDIDDARDGIKRWVTHASRREVLEELAKSAQKGSVDVYHYKPGRYSVDSVTISHAGFVALLTELAPQLIPSDQQGST